MKTKHKLAKVLREEGLARIAAYADLGAYDDYESDSPTPIDDLVGDLRVAGREDLAQRAIGGEWDGTGEEARDWFCREGRGLLQADKRAK